MRVSIVSGTALSYLFVERFPDSCASTAAGLALVVERTSGNDAGDHPLLRDLNALRISSTNSFGCSKAAKCPPLSSWFQ